MSLIRTLSRKRVDNDIVAVLLILGASCTAITGVLRETGNTPYYHVQRPVKRTRRREIDVDTTGSSFSKSVLVYSK